MAQTHKSLCSYQPKLQHGPPPKQARKLVRQQRRLQQKISKLFTYRFLFVQCILSPKAHPLPRIARGLSHLRMLRAIMDPFCRLFDHRCRVSTARAKLTHLRQRVQRLTQLKQALQPLFSGNLEKALAFPDEHLLPATSNAVERGNRCFRKMHKAVYRIGRIALDVLRDAFIQAHIATL